MTCAGGVAPLILNATDGAPVHDLDVYVQQVPADISDGHCALGTGGAVHHGEGALSRARRGAVVTTMCGDAQLVVVLSLVVRAPYRVVGIEGDCTAAHGAKYRLRRTYADWLQVIG